MSEKIDRNIVLSKGGVINDLTVRIKLIVRLMADRRVNPLIKLLPIGALFYLIMPDLALGPFDDAAVLWLGTFLFVELCPADIVKEHMLALEGGTIPGQWRDPLEEADVVDAEYIEHPAPPGQVVDGELRDPASQA